MFINSLKPPFQMLKQSVYGAFLRLIFTQVLCFLGFKVFFFNVGFFLSVNGSRLSA